MKRNMVIGIAVVLALTLALVIATAAFAQGPAGTQDGVRDLAGNGNCAAFVDADGDGVCDNAGKGMGHAWGFVDENGDGVNDNFVDADKDGKCDMDPAMAKTRTQSRDKVKGKSQHGDHQGEQSRDQLRGTK